MADQTEQEQIDAWEARLTKAVQGALRSAIDAHGPLTRTRLGSATKRVFAQARALCEERLASQKRVWSQIVQQMANQMAVQADQHAAQVRERDAQIARKETALNMWRGWAQFVYLKGGPVTLDDEALRAAVCVVHDDETATLRAERDAAQQEIAELDRLALTWAESQGAYTANAKGVLMTLPDVRALQQQIATLTAALTGVKSTARGHLCWCDNSHNAVTHGHQPKCVAAIAALQSTRPQEQP